MAQNGLGAPMAGHIGRIPNYGKTQVNPMGNVEPPACIQNAMMTKDKKPFTYTPGGLDLSQIKTPSMARRFTRQRSQEEHEQAYAQAQANAGANYHPQGGPAPPPPPPAAPAPPPPPPLVIQAPSKSPKPIAPGERPEIVIPENPIGMLRKTNSPYHWEAEKAEMDRVGPVPKFVEKVPSPLTVKMPPSTFSQQPPQNYSPQGQNNFQRQNYPNQSHQAPESPLHRPEAQYAHQKPASPNVNGSPVTREILQRQDSQFNKSPQPFAGQSPVANGSPFSPTPNNNWRQPERRDSPANNAPQYNRSQYSPNVQQQFSPNYQNQSPPANNMNNTQSPQYNRNQFSPNVQQQYAPNYQNQSPPANSGPVYHTLPRTGQRMQDNYANNAQNNNASYNNVQQPAPQSPKDPAPWRTNTLNRHPREPDNVHAIYHNSQNTNQQPTYTPPWKGNEANNNQTENNYVPPWKQEGRIAGQPTNQPNQQQQYVPPWVNAQDANNNRPRENCSPPWRGQSQDNRQAPLKVSQPQEPPRYQSTMSIPVTARKQNTQPEYNNPPQSQPQKEIVYVNQEPVYYCPESPKSIPPWVKTQKEKTKTPPPAWCQRPLEGRRSAPRELVTPPRDGNNEPEWVKKSNEMQRNVREVISPPKYQQPVQPNWSTRPSDNRKSLPKDAPNAQGGRVIPIQLDVSSEQGGQHQPPTLRIMINTQPGAGAGAQGEPRPLSQPTQRIMRVLSPQLVRMDEGAAQPDLPALNRTFQSLNTSDSQHKTRIIPIQIEGGNGGANKRVFYHKFTQEGPPRQSKAFRVLQIITGTQEVDDIQAAEDKNGFSDL